MPRRGGGRRCRGRAVGSPPSPRAVAEGGRDRRPATAGARLVRAGHVGRVSRGAHERRRTTTREGNLSAKCCGDPGLMPMSVKAREIWATRRTASVSSGFRDSGSLHNRPKIFDRDQDFLMDGFGVRSERGDGGPDRVYAFSSGSGQTGWLPIWVMSSGRKAAGGARSGRKRQAGFEAPSRRLAST